jgi:hypothetical protein
MPTGTPRCLDRGSGHGEQHADRNGDAEQERHETNDQRSLHDAARLDRWWA